MSPARSLPPEVAALWPPSTRARLARRGGAGSLEYFVAPAGRRPRILVPRAVKRADRMFVRHGGGLLERAVWDAWRRGQRSGLTGRLPVTRLVVDATPDGIESYLAAALAQPVSIGVLLGPPRANRKPVLQIFAADGATIGFAKVAMSELTRELQATEAAALQRLQGMTTSTFRSPRVLHHGTWNDLSILVQEALGSAQSRQAPVEPPLDVMVEIAAAAGISSATLTGDPYLDEVAPQPGDDWLGIDVSALRRLHDRIADPADGRPLAFGSWHGDFGPWNMGRDGATIEVWDWERFSTRVPVGLDAAHYRAQVSLAKEESPESSWPRMVRDVEAVLAASGIDTSDATRVAACYLLAICARYRHDAGDAPTPALRRRMSWLADTADIAAARVEVSAS